jgi:predicted membrane-bound dolichyl-phosphate-mannose-protein mannosyltransferase
MYINPIPYLDEAKEFEMRIRVVSDEVIPADEAKRKVAEFIKSLSVEELCEKWIACKMFPVYPNK